MVVENIPLITVICTSYNHQEFIKKCLDGFVMQQTTFRFEIIVHDDASTDETQQIVKEYELKFPELFNNIYQIENQYSKKEINIWYDIIFPKAKGKYIALCEGDDYWIDPLKLQKQFDFLESNPKYGMVCTDFEYFYQRQNSFGYNKYVKIFDEISLTSLLIAEYHIGTCTVCFRSELYISYLRENRVNLKNWMIGDLPLWIYIAGNSKIYLAHQRTSVYRVLEESVAHSKNSNKAYFFEENARDIRLFFLNIYDSQNIKIKNSIEASCLLRKITINVQLNDSTASFMSFLISFLKINRSFSNFKGLVKQVFFKFKKN